MRDALLRAPRGAHCRAVMAAVLMHIGTNGQPCSASVQTLADLAGIDKRHAQRALAELVPDHLTRTDRPGYGMELGVTPVSPLPMTPASSPPVTPVSGVTPVSPVTPASPKGEELKSLGVERSLVLHPDTKNQHHPVTTLTALSGRQPTTRSQDGARNGI